MHSKFKLNLSHIYCRFVPIPPPSPASFASQLNYWMLGGVKRNGKTGWNSEENFLRLKGPNTLSTYTHFPVPPASHNDNNESQLTSSTVLGFSLCNRKSAELLWKFSSGGVLSFLPFVRLPMPLSRFPPSIAIYIASLLRRACTLTLCARGKTLSLSLWCSSVNSRRLEWVDSLLCRFYCFKFKLEMRSELFFLLFPW